MTSISSVNEKHNDREREQERQRACVFCGHQTVISGDVQALITLWPGLTDEEDGELDGERERERGIIDEGE